MKLGYTLIYVDDVEKTMKFYATAFKLEMGFLSEDVVNSFSEAVKAGAISVSEPIKKPWDKLLAM